MPCIDWIRFIDLTPRTLTIAESDRWSWEFSHPYYPVPKIVRYRHHPRVSQSNPQMPRTRYNKAFRGHRFRVGRSKK